MLSAYLANLAVLSGFFLFTKTQSCHAYAKPTPFAIILSTVFAFVPFCCIVFYETVVLIKKNCKLIRCRDIYHNNEASPMHFSISYCRDPVIHSREEQPLLDLSDSSNQPTY